MGQLAARGNGRVTDFDEVEETSMLGVKRSEYSPIGVILPVNIIDQDH